MKYVLTLACLASACFAASAHAATLKLPADKPVVEFTAPDNYEPEKTEDGYDCESPDGSVTLMFEMTTPRDEEEFVKADLDYLAEEKVIIDQTTRKTGETERNGFTVKTISWNAKQVGHGDETITMYFFRLNDVTTLLVTSWVTKKREAGHRDEIEQILDSIKRG